jgi:Hypothetical protein (DUF2513)
MKLNLDLVRALLAQVDGPPHDDSFINLSIEGFDGETVSEHIRLLDGLGYVTAIAVGTFEVEVWKSVRLTWKGADFLARARDGVAWEHAKQLVEGRVVGDPEVILEVLKRLLNVCADDSSGGQRPDGPQP